MCDEVPRQPFKLNYFSPPDTEPCRHRSPTRFVRPPSAFTPGGGTKVWARYRDKGLRQLYPGEWSGPRRDERGRFDRDAFMKLFALGRVSEPGRVRDFHRHFGIARREAVVPIIACRSAGWREKNGRASRRSSRKVISMTRSSGSGWTASVLPARPVVGWHVEPLSQPTGRDQIEMSMLSRH